MLQVSLKPFNFPGRRLLEVGKANVRSFTAAAKEKAKKAIDNSDVTGKAQELKGEAKGKAQELKGEASGAAAEAKGKAKGAAAEAKSKL
jgi:uncharacterized protein YjbJ (UPF0337 family)